MKRLITAGILMVILICSGCSGQNQSDEIIKDTLKNGENQLQETDENISNELDEAYTIDSDVVDSTSVYTTNELDEAVLCSPIKVAIQTEALNVRSVPEVSGEILGKVYAGQSFDIMDTELDQQGDVWYQIQVEDVIGWIIEEYCYLMDEDGHYYSKRMPYDIIDDGYIIMDDSINVEDMDSDYKHSLYRQLKFNYAFYRDNRSRYDFMQQYSAATNEAFIEDYLTNSMKFVRKGKVYSFGDYQSIALDIIDDFYTLDYSDDYYGYLDADNKLQVYSRSDQSFILRTIAQVETFRIQEDGLFFTCDTGVYHVDLSDKETTLRFLTSEKAYDFTQEGEMYWLGLEDGVVLAVHGESETKIEVGQDTVFSDEGLYLHEDFILKKMERIKGEYRKVFLNPVLSEQQVSDYFYMDGAFAYLAFRGDGGFDVIQKIDIFEQDFGDIIYENEDRVIFDFYCPGYEYTSNPLIAYSKEKKETVVISPDISLISYAMDGNKIYMTGEYYDECTLYELDRNTLELTIITSVEGTIDYCDSLSSVAAVVITNDEIYSLNADYQKEHVVSKSLYMGKYKDWLFYADLEGVLQVYNVNTEKKLPDYMSTIVDSNLFVNPEKGESYLVLHFSYQEWWDSLYYLIASDNGCESSTTNT